jgi:hypothetical protein
MRPLFTYLRAEVVTASVFAATGDWVGEADTVTPLPKRIERAGREFATRTLEAGTTLPRAARRPAGGPAPLSGWRNGHGPPRRVSHSGQPGHAAPR